MVWRYASAQATLCSMGTQLPPEQRAHPLPPSFWPCLLWLNGWMDEDATWYRSRPRSRPHCVRRGPSSPQRGHSTHLLSVHVYCGHGRPSELLLSCCRRHCVLKKHLKLGSLGTPESLTQTAYRPVKPILHSSPQSVPLSNSISYVT